MDTAQLLQALPPEERERFLDITQYRVLGASKHIRLIGEIFAGVAAQYEGQGQPFSQALQLIGECGRILRETRGDASRAVYNAVGELLSLLAGISGDGYARTVAQRVAGYQERLKAQQQKIADYAARLAEPMDAILVFDYSSTVAAFLRRFGESRPGRVVYIPESRVIGGGAPFVSVAAESGLQAHMIPDAALYYYLKRAQGVFIGAETFFPDGTAFNTTGSEMAARLCAAAGVPYYVLTPLNKVDGRARFGHQKPVIMRNMARALAVGIPEPIARSALFDCPELLAIPSDEITAYITEEGILPPACLYEASLRYLNALEETSHDAV